MALTTAYFEPWSCSFVCNIVIHHWLMDCEISRISRNFNCTRKVIELHLLIINASFLWNHVDFERVLHIPLNIFIHLATSSTYNVTEHSKRPKTLQKSNNSRSKFDFLFFIFSMVMNLNENQHLKNLTEWKRTQAPATTQQEQVKQNWTFWKIGFLWSIACW